MSPAPREPDGAEVVTIETPALGDRSYLVHDGEVAAVIDPQRDIERVLDAAAAIGVTIVLVAETHVHNDYVTGGLALARRTGAAYVLAAEEELGFERTPAADGDRFPVGRLGLTALATPGHTPGHLAYLLDHAGTPSAVFTGGSMLFGSVGRTDLLGQAATDALTRAQFRSVRRLAGLLGDDVDVYPTHGFGSFCAATPTTSTASTVGIERAANPALVDDDEEDFVQRILAGLGDHPAYYAHMGPLNRSGPGAVPTTPPAVVGIEDLRRTIAAGGFVIDLRARRAFAAAHLRGTLSFELNDPLATYLGWTIPWGAPLTLLGATADDVAAARTHLARIGIDRLAGHLVGDPVAFADEPLASYPVRSFADLAEALRAPGAADRPTVVDVRRVEEWRAGHVPGAVHVPLGELPARLGDLPTGAVWVHCAAGYRASVAAGWIARAGGDVTLIDDQWDRAVALGLTGGTDGG